MGFHGTIQTWYSRQNGKRQQRPKFDSAGLLSRVHYTLFPFQDFANRRLGWWLSLLYTLRAAHPTGFNFAQSRVENVIEKQVAKSCLDI
jgi:hypothetical protein